MKKAMNQIFRRKKMYLFAGVLMAILMLMPVTSAKAATYSADGNVVQYEKGKTAVLVLGTKGWYSNYYSIQIGKKNAVYDKVQIKSSNSKVVEAQSNQGLSDCIKVKKAGTSKLTISLTKNGKTQKYTMNIKVVKYVNPFKTISVNNKNITSQLNKPDGAGVNYKVKGNKYAFKCTLKKDWKIVKLSYSIRTDNLKKHTCTYLNKTLKGDKAKKFTLSLKSNQKIDGVTVIVYNTKTKVSQLMYIGPTN